jgi:hypothetical protein
MFHVERSILRKMCSEWRPKRQFSLNLLPFYRCDLQMWLPLSITGEKNPNVNKVHDCISVSYARFRGGIFGGYFPPSQGEGGRALGGVPSARADGNPPARTTRPPTLLLSAPLCFAKRRFVAQRGRARAGAGVAVCPRAIARPACGLGRAPPLALRPRAPLASLSLRSGARPPPGFFCVFGL